MGCCTIRTVMMCGIVLAGLDILHGLASISFYVYKLIVESFHLCQSNEMDAEACYYKNYFYKEMYETRVYVGIGEGLAGILFAIVYIITLVKRKPSLTWLWLLKSFVVIVINVYYLSTFAIRRGRYEHIHEAANTHESLFIHAGLILTGWQIVILIVYCILASLFTYKVVEEKRASRRSLRMSGRWGSAVSGPTVDRYDPEEAETLTCSDKTMPIRGSKHSLTDLNRQDTFKHSTGV